MEPTHSSRRAVIDIGTNSVKLLVADVAGRQVRPVWEESRQTRLGRGFFQTRTLQGDAIADTARAVADFAATARQWEAVSVRTIATSATREAVNSEELTTAIQKTAGLRVEIISGEQEADWAFQGVTTDLQFAQEPLLLLDAGGGSTEFILGLGEHKFMRHSVPLGTVRLLEMSPPGEPPTVEQLTACRQWVRQFLQAEVRPRVESARAALSAKGASRDRVLLVGTGGTASILGCIEAQLTTFDRGRLDATRLSRERVRGHVERLWGLPLAARKQVVGLPPNRADVILTGVVIYEMVMEQLSFSELCVSTRGLRFGALMTALAV